MAVNLNEAGMELKRLKKVVQAKNSALKLVQDAVNAQLADGVVNWPAVAMVVRDAIKYTGKK